MARPQQFERQDVVKALMLLFWQRGYVASSMQDLQAATGLKASSLYNSFGNKEQLFNLALERYLARVVHQRCQLHLLTSEGLSGIRRYLRSAVEGPNSERGCLLVNSISQMGSLPESVNQLLYQGVELVRQSLREALDVAQQTGELSPEWDTELFAQQLEIFFRGLMVQNRMPNHAASGDTVIAMFDQMLLGAEPKKSHCL